MMNPYVGWLHQVAKLVYLVGTLEKTAQVKKLLDPNDSKNRIHYRCLEELPPNTLSKLKLEGVRDGILRNDWLNKITQRYPQMVIFLFSCGEETDVEAVEGHLREILKKVNLFMIDILKANAKEEVAVRIVVSLTKAQSSNPLIMDRANYYLKAYEKDTFVVPIDNLARDITKYRYTWLTYLEKNYEKKLRKLQRKLQEAVSLERRIGYSFKIAIFSEMLCKDQRLRYSDLTNMIRFRFSELTTKELTLIKYLDIRELRTLADIALLRLIRQRLIQNPKELPLFIQDHLNFFKMRNLDPQSCHFFYYYEELIWRSSFLQQVLEVLGANDQLELLPQAVIAEWLNGLLSYLFRLATVSPQLLEGLEGQEVSLAREHFVGRYDYGDVTDADVMKSETNALVQQTKDFGNKGIQLITRYKSWGFFRTNQINFLNIYLIRFYLAEGKFTVIANVYNDILKIEVNRCNYFLINCTPALKQNFSIRSRTTSPEADSLSRQLIHGVLALIADYFENQAGLNKYLQLFLDEVLPKNEQHTGVGEETLFKGDLSPDAHILKLKKNSHILAARVYIGQQIILGNDRYQVKLRLFLGKLLRDRLSSPGHRILIKFNHAGMVAEVGLRVGEDEGEWVEREVEIEPLYYVHKDSVFHIEEVHLVMENRLVWLLQRNQLVFEKYDSTMFHSNISQPSIDIQHLSKIYFLNETFSFSIRIHGIDDCKVSGRLSVEEEEEGKTQFFMAKEAKVDLTNSNKSEQLAIGTNQTNTCWVKCNKLGPKTLKLIFNVVVEKYIEVKWRDKPMHIKSTYGNLTREVRFQVVHLFTIAKTLREAVTGNTVEAQVPLEKKMMMSFKVKANDHIEISQITHHNNPRKIKYHKNFKVNNLRMAAGDIVQLNLLFEVPSECVQQFDLFLTTLFIKWKRPGSSVDNISLDEHTIIHPTPSVLDVSLHQPAPLLRRQKGSLVVRIRNLQKEANNVYVCLESSQQLMRIGEKGKWQLLQGLATCDIEFSVLCMQTGIFEVPSLRVFLNQTDFKVPTANYLVHCL